MSYHKINLVVCLAALSASLLASTGDPPQMVNLWPTPVKNFNNWNANLTARRMSNSGALGHDNQLTMDFLSSLDGTNYYQAGWANYDSVGSYNNALTGTTLTQPASAYCRTYGGVTGGQFYETGVGGVPCWWDNSGGGPNLVDYGSPKETGLFWDVNHDSYGYDTFAGYYFDGSYKQGCVWNAYPGPFNSIAFPTRTGYNGSECRCINKYDDVAGQVFGSSSSPPAFWYYTGGTPPWTLVVPSNWPSGRDGYIVGITKRDSNGNVYAVGYELPTLTDPNSGQPFVYSYSSGAIRFLGTQYGPPTQISNEDYDVNDPIVSFSGDSNTTGLAYIWRGSPDPSSTYTGVFDDVWAYFDPDVAQYSSFAPYISGLNSDFQFGGFESPGGVVSPWIMDNTSAWHFAGASGYSVTTGTLTGGSQSDLATANGRFAQIKALAGGLVQTIVEADWVIPGTLPTEVGFRATDELDLSATNNYHIAFYNNATGGWDNQSIPRSSCPTYWQTQVATFPTMVGGNLSPYINPDPNNHLVRARITIAVTGYTSALYWYVDIDQLTFSYKP